MRLTAGFKIPAMAIAGVTMLVLSCGDGAVEPPPPPVPVATAVTVNPGSAALSALGATARFTAEVRDQNGQVMAGATVTWASSDASVATVNASGLVTAAANGSATITATAGSVSGTAGVTVAQVATAVAVSPSADTLVAFGDTVRLVAEATDANGHGVAGSEFAWSSSDTLVARVDETGLVESLAEGAVVVAAAASGVTGGAELSVVPPLPTTVALSPDTVRFTAFGQTAQLAAEVREQAGRVMAEATVSWSSGDTLVVAVDSAGLVTAVSRGTTTVTGAAGDVSDAVVVTVTQSAGTVVVSPAEGTIALGDTLRLGAEAFDENGHAVDAAVFSWSSSNAGVARVDGTGLVEGVGEGTARITGTAGDASGVAEITVENPDRTALVALYNATDGPNWIDNTNWLSDAPLGEWYGVETDASGRVAKIDLGGTYDDEARQWVRHGLVGSIPGEIGNLTNLEGLRLGRNRLTGTIPTELGRLASLEELDLPDNLLLGPIPPELGRLARLQYLDLEKNNLTDAIPPELRRLTNLRSLKLGHNRLTGTIPSEFADLVNLLELGLEYNGLTGSIPSWVSDLSGLHRLILRGNQLSGPIPPFLGDLSILLLGFNDFSGPIPPELGSLDRLRWLELHANNLTGPIPPELGNLTNLRTLQLAGNDLTGPVPAELGNLQKLEKISLNDNRLTGSLPLGFVKLPNLTFIECTQTDGLCVPATDDFREWIRRVEFTDGSVSIPFCDDVDKHALRELYKATSGRDWMRSDGWLEDEDLDRWHGVRTDSIGRVANLDLSGNGLSGHLPRVLGRLASLTDLRIQDNALSGRLPLSLTGLSLDEFDYADTSLCVADDHRLEAWLNGIPRHVGTGVVCPPLTDREILELLYWATGGPDWTENAGWLSEPLTEWHGVETNAAGQVVELQLDGNGLSGEIPGELGGLSHLERLQLSFNGLKGAIPPQLGGLPGLIHLDLAGNRLSGTVPPELGALDHLTFLNLSHNRLSGEIPGELGDLDSLEELRLYGNELSGSIPPELGTLANLRILYLHWNNLSGPIPVVFGDLDSLERLRLYDNELSGSIPPELGTLANLRILYLQWNNLSGPIPAELGGLHELIVLGLDGNNLDGRIPPSIATLSRLSVLDLAGNELTGPIPAELGSLRGLTVLHLGGNDLRGSVPASIGELSALKQFSLTNNSEMKGTLPAEVTALTRLEEFLAGGTELCLPMQPGFEAWIGRISKRRIARCPGASQPAAYLVQAVQSREFPVPLVAGEDALLRVFVTAQETRDQGIPPVRARFFVDDQEVHVEDIAAKHSPIPTIVDESSLDRSANAVIPGHVVRPGLEMVIDVDPDQTLDRSLGVAKRIPETGRLRMDVHDMPAFDLTVIPFLWEENPDSSIVELVKAMAADPQNHEMLHLTRTLLPIAELDIRAHEPVVFSTNSAFDLLRATRAIEVMEGRKGYYKGMMSGEVTGAGGVAYQPGWSSFSQPYAAIIAHELGHNLGLLHAPCRAPGTDPDFPHSLGAIGAWGYDFRTSTLVPPYSPDFMSYCEPEWVSDFNFSNTLRVRLGNDHRPVPPNQAANRQTLLVWGGMDASGEPFLEPAFVVDAPASLPEEVGEYQLTGLTIDGAQLFSMSLPMPNVADGDGSSSFAFTLPVQTEWAGNLASITLSGPGGSATLDQSTDRPMAILRDMRTGQVRAFLSDLPPATQTAADTFGQGAGAGAAPGLETLFSRGIPDISAWRR